MKNIKFILLVTLIFSLAGFSSCKKEDVIQKNLWSKDGTWKIVSSDETTTRSNGDNSHYVNEMEGSIVFKKDGTGILTSIDESEVETMPFTYTNTKETLTMVREGESITYTMEWSKNTLKLTWKTTWIDQTLTDGDVTVNYTSIIGLEKQ